MYPLRTWHTASGRFPFSPRVFLRAVNIELLAQSLMFMKRSQPNYLRDHQLCRLSRRLVGSALRIRLRFSLCLAAHSADATDQMSHLIHGLQLKLSHGSGRLSLCLSTPFHDTTKISAAGRSTPLFACGGYPICFCRGRQAAPKAFRLDELSYGKITFKQSTRRVSRQSIAVFQSS